MSDATTRAGIRSIVSGEYVPSPEEARDLIRALAGTSPDVVHDAIAQDAPLWVAFDPAPGETFAGSVDTPLEEDFAVTGLSALVIGGLDVSCLGGEVSLSLYAGKVHRFPLCMLARRVRVTERPAIYTTPILMPGGSRMWVTYTNVHNFRLNARLILHGRRTRRGGLTREEIRRHLTRGVDQLQ